MTGRTVVLTGGTAGIGAALADRLRRLGDRVLVVGRRAADGRDFIQADLSQPDAAERIRGELKRLGVHRLDILVHHAAVGWVGAFPEHDSNDIETLLRINLWSPIALTHGLAASAAPNVRVVFISSPVAHLPSPDYAVYAASKAAVEAFARSLRAERCGWEVQVIRPGATATEMLSDADAHRLGARKNRFATAATTAERIAGKLNGRPKWSGTDWPSRLAPRLNAWGALRFFEKRARIPWAEDWKASAPAVGPPTALITGAAAGVGRALSRRFSAADFSVVGVDCNAERLAETQRLIATDGGRFSAVVADLARVLNDELIIAELERRFPFDVVVHNAGVNRFGLFRDADLAEQERVFTVNLLAPIALTRELFARRLLREGCRLGFVSSLSHFVGYPGSAVYAATKSGLASFASSLAVVGRDVGFSTTTIFPGPTRTRQAFENSPDNSREHRRADPAAVADAIFRAMMQRRRVLIPGMGNRLAAEFGRRFPSVADAIMRRALLRSDSRRVG